MRKRGTAETDEVDDWYAIMQRGTPLPGDDRYELLCNAVQSKINQLSESDDPRDIVNGMRMQPQLRTAIIRMVHRGRDPKTVPYRHIRHALENPCLISLDSHTRKGVHEIINVYDDTNPGQRASIKGATRAVRVFCTSCMGGNVSLIRGCPTTNCQLWPFRMGSNPFFGRLDAAEAEAEVSDAELAEDALLEAEFDLAEQTRLDALTAEKISDDTE